MSNLLKSDDLNKVSKHQLKELNIGLKAENLVWIMKNGFYNNVPTFFILSTEVCDQINEKNSISEGLLEEIQSTALEMETTFYFVRSSAQYEDQPSIPTAGLFLTKGRVKVEDLPKAIVECVLRAREEKVINILGSQPKISIIIQKMIFPDQSGILFTKHPVSNDKSIIVIEAGYGLGETVVSGKFSTDHYEIKREDISDNFSSNVAQKEHFISPETNTIQNVPDQLRNASVLSDTQVRTLLNYALSLEKLYGKPIDLEWAIDNENKIWFLQIRDAQ